MAGPPLLEVERLVVKRGTRTVVDNLSFCVEAGQVLPITGPNGHGKTTLLETLAGFLTYEGTYRLWGRPFAEVPLLERARLLGYLPQHPPVPMGLQAIQVAACGAFAGLRWPQRLGKVHLAQAHAVLERLGFSGQPKQLLEELSGGQRQTVWLAQLLVQDPQVLLLDEPMQHLDVGARGRLEGVIDSLIAKGKGVVLVKH